MILSTKPLVSIFALAAIVLIAVSAGCLSGEPESVTPEGTSSRLVDRVTPTPSRTPTPVPTTRPNAAVPRVSTPTPSRYVPPTLPAGSGYKFTDISILSAAEWELQGYGSVKPVPDELDQSAQPLSADAVKAMWADLLGDTRFIVNGDPTHPITGAVRQLGDFDLLLCSAGYGVVMDVPPVLDQNSVGTLFEWNIEHSPASPWWGPTLVLEPRDPDFIPVYPEGGFGQGLSGIESYRRSIFIVGGSVWVDRFTLTELEVSLLTMKDPNEYCSEAIPEGVRLFSLDSSS